GNSPTRRHVPFECDDCASQRGFRSSAATYLSSDPEFAVLRFLPREEFPSNSFRDLTPEALRQQGFFFYLASRKAGRVSAPDCRDALHTRAQISAMTI